MIEGGGAKTKNHVKNAYVLPRQYCVGDHSSKSRKIMQVEWTKSEGGNYKYLKGHFQYLTFPRVENHNKRQSA